MKRKLPTSNDGLSSKRPAPAEASTQRVADRLQNGTGAGGIHRDSSLKSLSGGAACRKLKLGRTRSPDRSAQPLTASSEKRHKVPSLFSPPPESAIAAEQSASRSRVLTACGPRPADVVVTGQSPNSSSTFTSTPSSVKSVPHSRSMSANAQSCVMPSVRLDKVNTASTVCQQPCKNCPSRPASSMQAPKSTHGPQSLSKHTAGCLNSRRGAVLNSPKPHIPANPAKLENCQKSERITVENSPTEKIPLNSPKGFKCRKATAVTALNPARASYVPSNPPKGYNHQKSAVISSPAVYYDVCYPQKNAVLCSLRDRMVTSSTDSVYHKGLKTEKFTTDATRKDSSQLPQPSCGMTTTIKKAVPTAERVEKTAIELCGPKKPSDVSSVSKPGKFVPTFTPVSTPSHQYRAETSPSNSKRTTSLSPQVEKAVTELQSLGTLDADKVSKPATFTPSSTESRYHTAEPAWTSGEDMDIDVAISEVVFACILPSVL